MPTPSLARNLRIAIVSAGIGLIGCPALVVVNQLFGSLVPALRESFSGVLGTIFLIVIGTVFIEVGARKFANVAMLIIGWVLSKTNAHHSVAAAVSIILGSILGALLGANCYRLIWMSIQTASI